MPLSPQDQEYWKEKLGMKNFLRIATVTAVMGCVVWPLFQFIVSSSNGHGSEWTVSATSSMILVNFFLALLVSTLIWSIGQLYFYMDWLPPRK